MNTLIVENCPVFQEALKNILSKWLPAAPAVFTQDGAGAIRLLKSQSFSLLLLDLQIGDIDGFEIADAAITYSPGIHVIALGFQCNEFMVYQAHKRRICGFVDKHSASILDFQQAIAQGSAKLAYFSPSFQKIKSERTNNPVSFDKILSDREIEILAWIAFPLDDREIAALLGISIRTVETHRFNILRKLDLLTTTELIRYARRYGIIHSAANTRKIRFNRESAKCC